MKKIVKRVAVILVVCMVSVIDDRLFCTELTDNGMNIQYEILPNGSAIKTDYIYCGTYCNYYLGIKQDVGSLPLLCLVDYESGVSVPLLTNDIYISEISVYEDTLYYRYFFAIDETDKNIGNLCSINLLTGEEQIYDIVDLFGHNHELSYNFANGKLYLLSERRIVEINIKTKKVEFKDTSTINSTVGITQNKNNQNRLYSDGETIYLLVEDLNGKDKLVYVDDFTSLIEVFN